MKKGLLIGAIGLSALIGFNVTIGIENLNEESYVTLKNIEALADNGENFLYECLSFGSIECPNSPIKVKFVWW